MTGVLGRSEGFPEVLEALKSGRSATIDGAWGSAGPLTVAALGKQAPSCLLVVLAHVSDVDDPPAEVPAFEHSVRFQALGAMFGMVQIEL